MASDFLVTIGGERGAEWHRICGTRTFPVRSPVPHPGILPGIGEALVFELDLDSLPPGQLQKIVGYLAAKFRLTPVQAAAELGRTGIPILHTDCSVTILHAQRWL